MVGKKCSSCGTEVLKRYSEFNCPRCDGERIVRCDSCRGLGAKHKCGKCGFEIP